MCNSNSKPRLGLGTIPALLVAFGVPPEKADSATTILMEQFGLFIAAVANLNPKWVYDEKTGKPTNVLSGFEFDPGVADNWVIAFANHGGAGSFKYKDPEKREQFLKELQAKRDAAKKAGGGGGTTESTTKRSAK